MRADLQGWLDAVLTPVPAPPGMTSREIVRKAIEFGRPPRIPYSFLVPLRTDFFEVAVLMHLLNSADEGMPRREFGEVYYDEWGVGQKVTNRFWDQAVDHPLSDLRRLAAHRFPDVAAPERFVRLAPLLQDARAAGKYVVGADPVLMYERMRALMGFEALMTAPYTQPEGLGALLDGLADLTIAVIERLSGIGGVDGFMTWQDFGMQTGPHMRLETFREHYKPRFARVIAAAHAHGMHYIWHSCGQILDLIPEMVDLGVDVVQLDQPRLLGHRTLADRFGGRICFWNTVDIQWATGASVSADDLRAEIAEMVRPFARFNGGFMARHYPQPWDIGLSREFHELSYEAFLENGC